MSTSSSGRRVESASTSEALGVRPASDLLLNRPDIADQKVTVTRVRVMNHERTQDYALTAELHPLFEVATVREMVDKAYLAASHMQEMGLVSSCVPVIDVDPNDKNDYHIILLVEELKPIKGQVGVAVDNTSETQANLGVHTRSMAGWGENASANVSGGHRGTTMFNASLSVPLLGWQRYTSVTASVFRTFAHYPTSCYDAMQTGVQLAVNHKQRKWLNHTVALNAVWRHLSPHPVAAFDVRECAGHSLKQSLQHSVEASNEDNRLLPTKGVSAKLTHELAGGILGGSVHHTLQSLSLRATTQLGIMDTILCTSFRAARVQPHSARPPLSMIDREYLGGPTNLRGFSMHGSSLGGCASWSAAVHLYKSLYPKNMLYLHTFVSAGNVLPLSDAQHAYTLRSTAQALSHGIRASAGVGLTLKVSDFLRMELNYCVPLKVQPSDSAQPGLQFGVGVDFL